MSRFRKSGYFEAFCGPEDTKVPMSLHQGCEYVDDASLSLLAQQLSMQTLSWSPTSYECPPTPSTLPSLSRSSTITSTTSSSSRAVSVTFNTVDYSASSSAAPAFRQVDYSAATSACSDSALCPLDRPVYPSQRPLSPRPCARSSSSHNFLRTRRRNALSSPSVSPRLPARLLLLESAHSSQSLARRDGRDRMSQGRRDALQACLGMRLFDGVERDETDECIMALDLNDEDDGEIDNDDTDSQHSGWSEQSRRRSCISDGSIVRGTQTSQHQQQHWPRARDRAQMPRKVVGSLTRCQPRRVTTL